MLRISSSFSRLSGIVPVALLALMLGMAGCSITTSGDGTSDSGSGGDSSSGSGSTTVTGMVVDATTNSGISGATVSITENASLERTISVTSDSTGAFTLSNVPGGSQTLTAAASGFVGVENTYTIPSSGTYDIGSLAMSPSGASSSQWRAVLTWGESPSDLDFHTWTPNGAEIYFGNQGPEDGAELDVDDTSSYGPETITIDGSVSGTYVLFVHNWSGYISGTTLSDSGAVVQLYNGDTLYATYTVPSGSGTNDYWEIAHIDIDAGTATEVNTFSATEPSGANDGSGGGTTGTVTIYNYDYTSGTLYLYVDGTLAYSFTAYTVSPPTCGATSDSTTYTETLSSGTHTYTFYDSGFSELISGTFDVVADDCSLFYY